MEETVLATQRMEALVDDYRQAVNRLNARRRFGDGLFGFGSDPKRAPCHMDFYEGIGEEVARLEGLDAQQAGEMVEWLLSLGLRKNEPALMVPMLEAAQGHALSLIPLIDPQLAATLATGYARRYPPRGRFPIHTKILKALEKRAKE